MASLRGIFRKLIKHDPVAKTIMKTESKLPGSLGAALASQYAENVSSNPYKKGEASRTDIFAGGTKLSQKESNRRTGRAVGTAVGAWFGAGAAASAGVGSGISASEAAALGASADALSVDVPVIPEVRAEPRETRRPPTRADAQALLEAARGGLDPLTGGRRRRGRASTIFTGTRGAGLPTTAARTLLGE